MYIATLVQLLQAAYLASSITRFPLLTGLPTQEPGLIISLYLTYLYNIIRILKAGHAQNFINSKYIELGVFKVHLRLMILGNLGGSNHSH